MGKDYKATKLNFTEFSVALLVVYVSICTFCRQITGPVPKNEAIWYALIILLLVLAFLYPFYADFDKDE